ncbi:hypothetical protein [Sphingobium yanoikuyae]|uniref:hypothetical protein n=1 Tax=Sphingobium yanoikuyae TaxID=13690 RepID=UPI00345E58C5
MRRRPLPPAPAASDGKPVVRVATSGVGFEVGGRPVKISGSVTRFLHHENEPGGGADTDVVGRRGAGRRQQFGRSATACCRLSGSSSVTTNQTAAGTSALFSVCICINSDGIIRSARAAMRGRPVALQDRRYRFRPDLYGPSADRGWAEFKLGRDIGCSDREGILNDITWLSGRVGAAMSPRPTPSLGRIGIGYIYTDFQAADHLSSPSLSASGLGRMSSAPIA